MINSESGSYPGSVPQSTPTVPLGLTTLANIGAPAKPIGLTATPGNTEILLDWTAESGRYYNIYRATSSSPNSGKYLLCNLSSPVPGTAPSYVDQGLVNGVTYYYIIIASTSSTFLSGTLSPHSDEISATPLNGLVITPTPEDPTPEVEARNHPNPFDPTKESTKIIFDASASEVKLIIYDLRGRALWTKIATPASGNYYEVTWDGKSDFGEYVGNGSYIYLITAGGDVLKRGQLAVWK
jgi:hypothetical protein